MMHLELLPFDETSRNESLVRADVVALAPIFGDEQIPVAFGRQECGYCSGTVGFQRVRAFVAKPLDDSSLVGCDESGHVALAVERVNARKSARERGVISSIECGDGFPHEQIVAAQRRDRASAVLRSMKGGTNP